MNFWNPKRKFHFKINYRQNLNKKFQSKIRRKIWATARFPNQRPLRTSPPTKTNPASSSSRNGGRNHPTEPPPLQRGWSSVHFPDGPLPQDPATVETEPRAILDVLSTNLPLTPTMTFHEKPCDQSSAPRRSRNLRPAKPALSPTTASLEKFSRASPYPHDGLPRKNNKNVKFTNSSPRNKISISCDTENGCFALSSNAPPSGEGRFDDTNGNWNDDRPILIIKNNF